jgi:hypothetical protein
MTDTQIIKKAVERGFTLRYSIGVKVELLEAKLNKERDRLHDLLQAWFTENHPTGLCLLDEAVKHQEAKIKSLEKRIRGVKTLGNVTKPSKKEGITDYDIEMAMRASPEPLLGEPIRKAGNEWVFRSPFRVDKKPSLDFNIEKGLWIDRGTGEGGSIIDLVMRLEGCDFAEAVQKLNQYAQ